MEINELIKEYQNGNKEVFDEIYKKNIALIRAALNKAAPLSQRTRYIENQDLFQEAYYYFLLALNKFDADKGKWSSFLTSYVIFGIRSYMNHNKYLIRVPSTVYQWLYDYFRLYKENHDFDYISEQLGIPKEEIELYQRRTSPLSYTCIEEEPSCLDKYHSGDIYSYIDLINSFNSKGLTKKERQVYELYKSVDFEDLFTQVELSKMLNITQPNIIKIKKRLKTKLLKEG